MAYAIIMTISIIVAAILLPDNKHYQRCYIEKGKVGVEKIVCVDENNKIIN